MPLLREIIAQPLSREAFAPFGDVLKHSDQSPREFFNASLENTRDDAKFDLSIAKIQPIDAFPLLVKKLERHPCSSQTFIPIKASRYLVIVAPDNAALKPDTDSVRAFVAENDQAITYRCGVWHYGMTVLDKVAEMAVLMWCDGGKRDEEFIDLVSPFKVMLPNKLKC